MKAIADKIWERIGYHTKAIEDLHRKLQLIAEVEAIETEIPPSNGECGPAYSAMGLKKSVRHAVSIYAAREPKSLREIRNFLTDHGLPKVKFLTQNVNAILRILEKEGEIKASKRDGRRKQFQKVFSTSFSTTRVQPSKLSRAVRAS